MLLPLSNNNKLQTKSQSRRRVYHLKPLSNLFFFQMHNNIKEFKWQLDGNKVPHAARANQSDQVKLVGFLRCFVLPSLCRNTATNSKSACHLCLLLPSCTSRNRSPVVLISHISVPPGSCATSSHPSIYFTNSSYLGLRYIHGHMDFFLTYNDRLKKIYI